MCEPGGKLRYLHLFFVPNDDYIFNDSTDAAFNFHPLRALASIMRSGSIDSARGNSWQTSSGHANTADSTSSWTSGFPFASETITCEVSTSTPVIYDYLYLTNIQAAGLTQMRFRSAVTLDLFGSSPLDSLGNDTMKVQYSTDCGLTWIVLRTFSQRGPCGWYH